PKLPMMLRIFDRLVLVLLLGGPLQALALELEGPLLQGGLVIGLFLRADADTVLVDLKGESRAIKLNDVESLAFTSEVAPAAKTVPETPVTQPAPTPDLVMINGRKAYTALRKLSAAAQIGLPYGQYGSLLVETKAMVDESLATLPDGALKGNLAAVIEAYTDAGQAWGAAQGVGALPIASEPGATLMKKYSIKPAVNALGQEDRLMLDTTLTTIWAAANAQLNNVGPMLKM
ncbi:MAG: hypothetical protein ABI977_18700, partial [Acidobacteriota bacterium]